jgi:hypothetical protein
MTCLLVLGVKREVVASMAVDYFLLCTLGRDERLEEDESWFNLLQLENSHVKLPLICDEHDQRPEEAAVLVEKNLRCRKLTFAPELRSGPWSRSRSPGKVVEQLVLNENESTCL